MINCYSVLAMLSILCGSLSLLVWRLLDFADEAAQGSVHMSMGSYQINGYAAVTLQTAIIIVLFVVAGKSALRLRRTKPFS